MRKLRITPILSLDEAESIVAALVETQRHALAEKMRRTIDSDVSTHEMFEDIRKKEEERRLARAEHHVLTQAQAECLASVRAGHGALGKPYLISNGYGVSEWRWLRGRTMGGALGRMVTRLVEEGLLTDRRKLTEPGLRRLEAWEEEHGRIGRA